MRASLTDFAVDHRRLSSTGGFRFRDRPALLAIGNTHHSFLMPGAFRARLDAQVQHRYMRGIRHLVADTGAVSVLNVTHRSISELSTRLTTSAASIHA
jgi:hypothetical protein